MIDPITGAGVVGIVSFGIQLSQLIQKHLDNITAANGRLLQFFYELRATATGLSDLHTLLLDEKKSRQDRIFSELGMREIQFTYSAAISCSATSLCLLQSLGNQFW